ncbi:hypothetical protein HY26_18195 [Hyphomonas sp. GM-8P]|nr:hypothetical protein HY26_18195 [Hyphomonas sp. GM-8P]
MLHQGLDERTGFESKEPGAVKDKMGRNVILWNPWD